MSEMSGKYKKIVEELESKIKDPAELEFVKGKFAELSMVFMDMVDRITRLTDNKVQEIESRQQELLKKVNSVQNIIDEIEGDIYEEDDIEFGDDDTNYEFEIVCPYCNYQFAADIEDESREEIKCPECHNTIELDWNCDDELNCGGESDVCHGHCSICDVEGKDCEIDQIPEIVEEKKKKSSKKKENNKQNEEENKEEDEDM